MWSKQVIVIEISLEWGDPDEIPEENGLFW